MKAKAKRNHITFWFLIGGIVLGCLYFSRALSNKTNSNESPSHEITEISPCLKDKRSSIYVVRKDIFEFDVSSNSWKKNEHELLAMQKSDVAIHNRKIYFYDFEDNAVKEAAIGFDISKPVLSNQPFSTSHFAVSKDGKKLAYFTYLDGNCAHSGIYVLDLESQKKSDVCKFGPSGVHSASIQSLSWNQSGDGLFFSRLGTVFYVGLVARETHAITEGYGVQSLSKDTIGYCRYVGNYTIFYTKDIQTGFEKKVLATDEPTQASAWGPNGDFIVAAVPVYPRRLLKPWLHVIQLHIWDIATQREYKLPKCDVFSGCILWESASQN